MATYEIGSVERLRTNVQPEGWRVVTARLWDMMRIYAPALEVSSFAQTSPCPWFSLLTIAVILAPGRGASAPQPYVAAARP
jgi:hypothetical protein